MAKCQVCAYDNEEGAEYCEECGVKIGSSPPQPASSTPVQIIQPVVSTEAPQAPETPIPEVAPPDEIPAGPTMSCPACGHPTIDGTKFCPKCGIRMDVAPPSSSPGDARKCSSCGVQADPGALFCCSCGTRIGGGESVPPPKAKPKGDVIRLRMVAGKEKDRVFEIEKNEIRLGRLSENDIALENDGYVSGKHTRISRQGSEFFVEDLGSTNGTFLKVRKLTRIVPGDEIKVGQSIFRLE